MSRCVTSGSCYASSMLTSSSSRWLVAAAVFFDAASAAAAAAPTCLFAPPELHRVDAALRGSDVAAPSTPVVVSVDAFRRNGMTCTRASCVANSCGSTGTVRIDLAPSADDVTPPDELGYRLVLVRGELPESLRRSIDVPLAAGQTLYLRPGFDELPSLDIALAAVAIDAAGNESTPTEPFEVHFDGCTLASVGDRCEDEIDMDSDLSGIIEDDLDDELPDLEGTARGASGVSCSYAPGRSAADGAALLGLLGAFLARVRSRRFDAAGCRRR